MPTVKTAISMPKSIFDEVNEAASELGLSRSGVIVQALKDFLYQRESDRMLAQLNEAYADEPDEEEGASRRRSATAGSRASCKP